jgi:hypothetical protein
VGLLDLMQEVWLLGGCQQLCRCSAWALVAEHIGLHRSHGLALQQLFVSELMHLEPLMSAQVAGPRAQAHMQTQTQPPSWSQPQLHSQHLRRQQTPPPPQAESLPQLQQGLLTPQALLEQSEQSHSQPRLQQQQQQLALCTLRSHRQWLETCP